MQTSPTSFFHLGIAPDMLKVLERLKFVTPTPIQHRAIPIALEGKDVVGIAQTGTGKTLAFGIPMVQRLASGGGRGLVVVPTRELAIQVAEVLKDILNPFKMLNVVLIGGMPIGPQISALRRNPHIIIATPGRLIDHIYQGTLDFKDMKVLVLDEADRMFDMGFAPQIERILSCLPTERQTMMFSATMPTEIIKLAAKHMQLPVHVEIAPSGTATEDVTQELFIVREDVKRQLLPVLLRSYRGTVLVFTRTKIKANRVARMIKDLGEKVAEIHSDRSMGQRSQAMDGFKSGRYRILVATDIASRGIDVSMFELVINYDLPEDIENYVHRIGRTGRAGREGHAITLATPQQSDDVARIERFIRKPLPRGKYAGLTSESFSSHAGEHRPPHHRSDSKRHGSQKFDHSRRPRRFRDARRHSK
jgi:ATP-dependent RNA helicase RhlE